MFTGFNFRVLVVDDEPSIRETSAAVLTSRGYEVRTAQDGFAALIELRRALPDLVISDLKMPNMGGFELLSIIRRRFPLIPVIAISGEYSGIAPEGLLADAFLTKGSYQVEDLFQAISGLLQEGPMPRAARRDESPVWIPRNNSGYYVVTCTECLRSFSVPEEEAPSGVREASCLHCDCVVKYRTDGLPRSKKPNKSA